MGLFDFAIHPGTKFTKEEIEIFDKNFCSISNYTSNKYDFNTKIIDDNVKTLSMIGVPCHEIKYRHQNIENPNDIAHIPCIKFKLDNQNQLNLLIQFYEISHESIIKVPRIENFPQKIVQVGWHGLGFITILEYENNDRLTASCEQLIKKNSIKFLENMEMDFKTKIIFD